MPKKLTDFNEIIGHKNIVQWFVSCIHRDRLPQVIMLQGPAGIGKSTLAKIVACEVACYHSPELLQTTKQQVILEDKSTACVRLYNMSNLKSQEAVAEVKADLSVGFSNTGRKVIIMDEAHGMSDEAQDSLLVQFETLPIGVYVIVCSTELDSFREAFQSRCLLRRLSNLSQKEMQTLLKNRITESKLTFELPINMIIQLISVYTGREPRRAINLLDSFEEGSLVSTADLETFFNVYEGKQVINLVKYLYTNEILLGLDMISNMQISQSFQFTLLEVVRVALEGHSHLIDMEGSLYIRDLVNKYGIDRLLGFAIDCTTKYKVNRNQMSGFFLKWCSSADEVLAPPKPIDGERVHLQDISRMHTMLEERPVEHRSQSLEEYQTLDMLLAGGETIV